ncbi:MAG: hypothetical protein PCFJNLEI_03354 [Verrucomicrobiae bacterium]|nr:hypothetical protein [Verrucomicrobiae bacterium]
MQLARANAVLGVLFFVVAGGVCGADDELRRALDQLSASYTTVQRQLVEREAAVRTLTESLAIARTESELFQKLWTEAQVRVQTLGQNIAGADEAMQQRQFVETLRALYIAEAERQRLTERLQRLVAVIESNGQIDAEVELTKQMLAAIEKPVAPAGGGSIEATRVLDVNPKLRLVILDFGVQQGARIGMPLIVWRGNRGVAELRIVEVRSKICGALVENVENNITLQAGDAARVSRK